MRGSLILGLYSGRLCVDHDFFICRVPYVFGYRTRVRKVCYVLHVASFVIVFTYVFRHHSTQATWALFSLASHPETQQRLRAEVLACPTSTPTMDELNALSYLDSVVRESLRLNPAIPGTTRIAVRDEEIPVGGGYVDRNGVKRSSITYVS